jgi:hypothetical protein
MVLLLVPRAPTSAGLQGWHVYSRAGASRRVASQPPMPRIGASRTVAGLSVHGHSSGGCIARRLAVDDGWSSQVMAASNFVKKIIGNSGSVALRFECQVSHAARGGPPNWAVQPVV